MDNMIVFIFINNEIYDSKNDILRYSLIIFKLGMMLEVYCICKIVFINYVNIYIRLFVDFIK